MRWFKRCKHPLVVCLHGDMILQTIRPWRNPVIARVRCGDCGKTLYDRELPKICTWTGVPH